MRGVFDDKTLEPAEYHHDTDLTLGPVMLLGIFFVLVLICALVFGLGYAVGHRGSQDPSADMKPAPDTQSSLQAGYVQTKPSASSQANVASAAENAGADQAGDLSASQASGTNAAAMSQSSAPGAGAGSSFSQAQVRPAPAPAANPPQSASGPGGVLNVAPAVAPAGALMVQIAAVSHPEDAEVLVNALRKRGYAVTARREATDSLIHVRIGPFRSRDEANRWSQKLFNDGYNAIVQP